MEKLMKAMHKNEKGFTLVELMVVVVIIGILVAIAIPIFMGITANANRNTTLANLRTIGGAISMYNAEVGGNPSDITYLTTENDPTGYEVEFLDEVPTGPGPAEYEVTYDGGDHPDGDHHGTYLDGKAVVNFGDDAPDWATGVDDDTWYSLSDLLDLWEEEEGS